RERHAKAVTAQTLQLEKLMLDLDTGLRGFVLTGKSDLLRPWTSAHAALPGRLKDFRRLASTTSDERRRAESLIAAIDQYVSGYAEPVVEIARTTPAASRTAIVRVEWAQELAGIRSRFGDFRSTENALSAARTSAAQRRSDEAIAAAVAGLIASGPLARRARQRFLGRPASRGGQLVDRRGACRRRLRGSGTDGAICGPEPETPPGRVAAGDTTCGTRRLESTRAGGREPAFERNQIFAPGRRRSRYRKARGQHRPRQHSG